MDNFASTNESLVAGPGNDAVSFPVCIGSLVDELINWLILQLKISEELSLQNIKLLFLQQNSTVHFS